MAQSRSLVANRTGHRQQSRHIFPNGRKLDRLFHDQGQSNAL